MDEPAERARPNDESLDGLKNHPYALSHQLLMLPLPELIKKKLEHKHGSHYTTEAMMHGQNGEGLIILYCQFQRVPFLLMEKHHR